MAVGVIVLLSLWVFWKLWCFHDYKLIHLVNYKAYFCCRKCGDWKTKKL